MNRKILNATLSVAVACITGTAWAAESAHWSYSGHAGPAHWGELDKAFFACDKGRNQSPIDLSGRVESDLPPIDLRYQPGGHEIVNNGHTIQVNVAPGSSLEIDGQTFALKQFHFHAPSENIIDSKGFPLEAHLVHADNEGNLAVVALMFHEGDENVLLARLWKEMPSQAGAKAELSEPVSAEALLPDSHDYYRFNGSLTTPPCSEGVRWLVMKQPVNVSGGQVAQFSKVIGFANNRPVQPGNARVVLQ